MNWLRERDAEPIAGYRLISPLGTGGFGEVWKCTAPGNIQKAIKFVYGNLNSQDGDAFRAEQELKAMERVKGVRHPFVLPMDGIYVVEGDLAIVMELAEKSLHDLNVEYQQQGLPGIPRDELLGYMRDAADGLDFLIEKHGLLHLDVKPRNLFVVGGRVKVADFGLVKSLERQSSSGLLAGVTPIYASPESFGGKVHKHSDQYSLAIVYLELLTGKRPFNGKNIRALALQHVSEPPDLTMLPERDRPAVKRALSKDPENRFSSCLAFVRALYDADPRSAEVRLGEMPTPGAHATPQIQPRRGAPAPVAPEPEEEVLARTNAEQEIGILRPTLLIGLGGFGRRALLDLRCRLLDHFGDLSQVPLYRFLYIDSDPEAVHKALYDAPEVALSSTEVFPLPLQPVANYRRRALESLGDWLPREKLYAMPRSLQPTGSRALGRLAFHDNYLRFMTRVRRELQIATHPESLAQSVAQTGLSLRDNAPRVYVLASGNGGSSGFLTDLAYAVTRQMKQLHLPVKPPTLFLYTGAVNDPASPKSELANVHATLTELNHFADAALPFTAQYGPDTQKVHELQAPYSATYLLALPNRTPEAQRACVAHLANYLNHELTTPLGVRLEAGRDAADSRRTQFRSFGAFSVWYPRGLVLRSAARMACDLMIQEWLHPTFGGRADEVEAACTRALSDPGLSWDLLSKQLDRAALSADGAPSELLARLLDEIAEDGNRPEVEGNPGFWATQAIEQLDAWLGTRATGPDDSVLRRSRVSVLFNHGIVSAAEEWEKLLLAHVAHLTDRPGRRIATAEEAVRRMAAFCEQAATAQAEVVRRQHEMVGMAREQLRQALDQCRGGGVGLSRLFGVGPARHLRNFLDELRVFAYARLGEDTLDAGTQFFQKLRGRLEDRLTDLGFCRQRLRHLQLALAAPADPALDPDRLDHNGSHSPIPGDAFGNVFQGASTVRVVLPGGAASLDQAATNFVASLTPEHYQKLDEAIQAIVLAPIGGLQAVCQKHGDLSRILSAPLIDNTAAFLSDLLPETDVAEAEISSAEARGKAVADHIHKFFGKAAPMLAPKAHASQAAFLLHPPGPASQAFAGEALRHIADLCLVPSSSPTDLTFCREQGFMATEDLRDLLPLCHAAYEELAGNPALSPHARFDVPEWLPLDV